MDFKVELAKLGYNNGNAINVETLVDEILPDLFSKQQGRMYSEEEVLNLLISKEENTRDSIEHNGVEYITPKEWFEQHKKK